MPAPPITLRPLTELPAGAVPRIASGYTSPAKYVVHRDEADALTTFTVRLEPLAEPYIKQWTFSADDLANLARMVAEDGTSFGAYAGDELIGLAITELHAWNRTLWVWELHVAPGWRGQGIGRQLIEQVATLGRTRDVRALVCEAQNTNVPAIRFYRRMGFTLDGIDLSYYTNHDITDGEVAFFMKRHLDGAPTQD